MKSEELTVVRNPANVTSVRVGNCELSVFDFHPLGGQRLYAIQCRQVRGGVSYEVFSVAGQCWDGGTRRWFCVEPTYGGELWSIGGSDWHRNSHFAIVSALSEADAQDDPRVRKFMAAIAGDYSIADSCVYIISDGTGRVKVGKANSVKKRLTQLQTGNANSLRVVAVLECGSEICAVEAEERMHVLLSHVRVRGEWYEISETDALSELRQAMIDCGINTTRILIHEIEG